MSITVDDVPAWTAQCLDVPQPTDPETARILAVLNRHRRDSSFSRLDTSDLQEDTGRRQPSDH
jgi:hypothetical protein